MAATLLGAITETFQGNAALSTAMPGSPWLDEPPNTVNPDAAPYAVISRLHEDEDFLDFEGEKEVKSSWLLAVYGVGEAATETQALAVKALLNAAGSLAVTGRNLIKLEMREYAVTLSPVRSPTGRRVTEVTMAYYAEWEYVG